MHLSSSTLFLIFTILLFESLVSAEPFFFGKRKQRQCRPIVRYQTIYHTEYVQVPEYKTVYETKIHPTTLYKDVYKTIQDVVYSTVYQPQYRTSTQYKQHIQTETIYSNIYKTIDNPVYVTSTEYIPRYVTRTEYQVQYQTQYNTVYTTLNQYSTKVSPVYHTLTTTMYQQEFITITQPQQTYITDCEPPETEYTYSYFEPATNNQVYGTNNQQGYNEEPQPYFNSEPEEEYSIEPPILSDSYDSLSPNLGNGDINNEFPSPPYYVPAVSYNDVIQPGTDNQNYDINNQNNERSYLEPDTVPQNGFDNTNYDVNNYGYDSTPPIYIPPKPEDQLSYLQPSSTYSSFDVSPGAFEEVYVNPQNGKHLKRQISNEINTSTKGKYRSKIKDAHNKANSTVNTGNSTGISTIKRGTLKLRYVVHNNSPKIKSTNIHKNVDDKKDKTR